MLNKTKDTHVTTYDNNLNQKKRSPITYQYQLMELILKTSVNTCSYANDSDFRLDLIESTMDYGCILYFSYYA